MDGPMVGKTIGYFFVGDFQGGPDGAFDIKIADITITHADGTITPIPTPLGSFNYGGDMTDVTNVSFAGERPGVVADAHLYLGDHLGSTVVEFSGGNWPVWKGEYTPFGQELDTQDTVNNYKFAGMEHDPESGLDHTQFRQYASVTGRWLSPDPYNGSYDLSNPQSFNRYSYVGNMPTGFTDPNGLFLGIPLAGGGWQAGVVAGAEVAVVAAIGYGISLGVQNIFGLFSHPQCHACDHPRPAGTGTPDYAGWDGNFGESLGLPVNGPQLGGGGVGGFFGVPSGCEFGPCGGGGFGFQQSGNYPNVGVNCRGIETYHLGLIFAQHCDATVSIGDGWLYSLSAGPIDGRLRGFVTKTHTLPTGAINFWKGRDGLGLAKCLISAASASQASPDAPEYHPVYGPNSNIWLNGIFSSCGVNLGIKTHGPYF